MKSKSYNHTTIHDTHPSAPTNLQPVLSKEQPTEIVPRPTKRYLKNLELNYLYCPDCESQSIHRNGKSRIGTQRFRCKVCGCQFVSQFNAVFPYSRRRDIFEKEFLENIKPSGLDKIGTGRKLYWSGARLEVLQMMESQMIKVRFNKLLKTMHIRGDRDYRGLLEFIMGEAYIQVT